MAVTLNDRPTNKQLVAAGNNSVEYEDVAGSMVAITDATDIDTTDQLNMFEAYQKVFVVNGSILRVADFVNTKIDLGTGNELTSPPAKGDTLTQLTSNATMVVDFVDPSSRYIYGYTTSKTFVTTAGYTLTSDDATAIMDPATAPKPDVVAEASTMPHWYNWTAYPDVVLNDGNNTPKSYGSLPAKAYLGTLYRGRCVLSGNPNSPHQWYMSRQTNPWDWANVANDSQSPVAGGNADAGEIGDIVTSLISYKDDYLIYGCATTTWMSRGDPAAGGVIDELSLTTGIFGAQSWCWDDRDNLYFWGLGGIYRIPSGFGIPELISAVRLPDILSDVVASGESLDPTTHRITMGYDRNRQGIIIAVTKISDGSNFNFWFDLRTESFFPESYPDVCGAYSLFYYPANDNDFQGLLIGSRDGYIRKHENAAKDDDSGATDTAIDSYVSFGPLPMAEDPRLEGKLTGLDCVTAGGEVGGGQSDSDDITFNVFAGRSAAEVIEKINADTNPSIAGTIKTPGRQRGGTIRRKVSGVYAGIKLQNDTAAETWGFEQLVIGVKKYGRLK